MQLPVLRITEADLVRDLRSILDRVQSGAELIVERDQKPIALVRPPSERQLDLPLHSRDEVTHYYEVTKPSLAYHTNITSPVYRLSELMFGSLLAAYVLGFLGIALTRAASLDPPLSPNPLSLLHADGFKSVLDQLLVPLAPTLFISIAYAYVTAGMYAIYHGAMLTRESLSFTGLRWDFLLSLLHAIFFGCSLLYPFLFPFFLGLTCLIAIWRQSYEFHSLAKSLSDVFYPAASHKSQYDDRVHTAFVHTLRKCLDDPEKYHLLRGWARSSYTFKIMTTALTAIPLIAAIIVRFGFSWQEDWVWPIATAVVAFVVCLSVIIRIHPILGQRAGLLYKKEMDAMDNQYHHLLLQLYDKCETQHSE